MKLNFSGNAALRGKRLAWTAALLAGGLAGCSGSITRVELEPGTPTVCDVTHQVCGIEAGKPVNFKVWGKGKCDSVGIYFGDSSRTFCSPWDFGDQGTNPCIVSHTYRERAWPGAKTVHAYSASNCMGESKILQNVLHKSGTTYSADFWLGFGQPGPMACNEVPNVSPLRKNTRIFVETNPDPNIRINFGCAFGGCIYNADGEANSVAPASFPAPGMKKYSLILKVGQQVVQGGTAMNFTTNQGGPLEVCVNDDNLGDNSGAWGIKFTVDESQAVE
jgi:hypothetical protein